MSSRDPHGDDWIEVLGGLLVALVVISWHIGVMTFKLIRWCVTRLRR